MTEPEPVLPFADDWPSRVDVGPGWFAIVTSLAEAVEAAAAGTRYQQVKQKAGDLCVYYEAPNEADSKARVEQLVRAAAKRAARTCEQCGQPGHRRDVAWSHVIRCDSHAPGSTSAEDGLPARGAEAL